MNGRREKPSFLKQKLLKDERKGAVGSRRRHPELVWQTRTMADTKIILEVRVFCKVTGETGSR